MAHVRAMWAVSKERAGPPAPLNWDRRIRPSRVPGREHHDPFGMNSPGLRAAAFPRPEP